VALVAKVSAATNTGREALGVAAEANVWHVEALEFANWSRLFWSNPKMFQRTEATANEQRGWTFIGPKYLCLALFHFGYFKYKFNNQTSALLHPYLQATLKKDYLLETSTIGPDFWIWYSVL
jgi:hypothetical protein